MKTQILTAMVAIAATFSTLDIRALCQSGGTLGENTPAAPTTTQQRTGFAVQDGVTYFVRNNRVNPVNDSLIPKGQIMTATGRLESQDTPVDGFILREGVVYYSRAGVMSRIDTGMVPGGQIITLQGNVIPMPNGVIGFPGVQAVTVPGPRAGTSASER